MAEPLDRLLALIRPLLDEQLGVIAVWADLPVAEVPARGDEGEALAEAAAGEGGRGSVGVRGAPSIAATGGDAPPVRVDGDESSTRPRSAWQDAPLIYSGRLAGARPAKEEATGARRPEVEPASVAAVQQRRAREVAIAALQSPSADRGPAAPVASPPVASPRAATPAAIEPAVVAVPPVARVTSPIRLVTPRGASVVAAPVVTPRAGVRIPVAAPAGAGSSSTANAAARRLEPPLPEIAPPAPVPFAFDDPGAFEEQLADALERAARDAGIDLT